MTEAATLSPHKAKALELASQQGGTHDEVIARANAYHAFLLDKAAPKAAPVAGAAAATAAGAAPKAAPAAAPKAAPKATPAPGTAPAAPKATAPGAAPKATPKAPAAAGATTPKGDTKAPDGTHTYDDVVAALQSVMHSVPKAPGEAKSLKGQTLAYEILAKHGGGVKGVRDLKPTLYDAVVAACQEAVKPKSKPKAAAAPTATVVTDDFGQPIDTSGASVETAGEDDQPESGSGEDL